MRRRHPAHHDQLRGRGWQNKAGFFARGLTSRSTGSSPCRSALRRPWLASGPGKTWIGCTGILKHAYEHPVGGTGYFAPTYPLIRDIFYPTLAEVAETMGLRVKVKKADHEAGNLQRQPVSVLGDLPLDGQAGEYRRVQDRPRTGRRNRPAGCQQSRGDRRKMIARARWNAPV